MDSCSDPLPVVAYEEHLRQLRASASHYLEVRELNNPAVPNFALQESPCRNLAAVKWLRKKVPEGVTWVQKLRDLAAPDACSAGIMLSGYVCLKAGRRFSSFSRLSNSYGRVWWSWVPRAIAELRKREVCFLRYINHNMIVLDLTLMKKGRDSYCTAEIQKNFTYLLSILTPNPTPGRKLLFCRPCHWTIAHSIISLLLSVLSMLPIFIRYFSLLHM